MIRKVVLIATPAIAVLLSIGLYVFSINNRDSVQKRPDIMLNNKPTETIIPTSTPAQTPTPEPLTIPPSKTIPLRLFAGQTFNNCGPASLSMFLSYYDINVNQAALADILRPNRNPQGINDDKSVFLQEFIPVAESYNLTPYHRYNGTIELLKQFIAQDIPVIARAWLNPGEDIGHYYVVRGYNDATQTLLMDDSYHGPNRTYSYEQFLEIWQPFNYEYFIAVPQGKKEVTQRILGEEVNAHTALQNSLKRAEEEMQQNPNNPYPKLNIAIVNFYQGNYEQAVQSYEEIESQLPPRMLWYRFEPIVAYQKTKQYDKALAKIDVNLQRGNIAYAEMYIIRGQIFEEQGKTAEAQEQFNLARRYNSHYENPEDLLKLIVGE